MPPSLSPTIPHWATSPATHCPHSPGTGSTGADLQPHRGSPHPEGSHAPPVTTQEWEGDGWEATGWQAGAARQGKHGTGCNARDLEITLSYKGKKVQAGRELAAGSGNSTVAELRGTLGPSPDLSEQHKEKTSHCLSLLKEMLSTWHKEGDQGKSHV